MRTFASQVCLSGSMALASVLFAAELRAQVIPDGTTGTTGGGSCATLCTITGGTTAGRNLFHSFDQFSIPRGGGAAFDNALGIENIFSRVTGRLPSNIDGLIRANGTANLFLINPNGIIFGPGAQLDIQGSFIASTANAIGFGDIGQFSATSPAASNLLNISPSALFFNAIAAQNITNRSQALGITGGRSPNNFPVGLQVPTNRTLALIGGNVLFEGGNVTASRGQIILGAVQGSGVVGLNLDSNGLSVDYTGIPAFGEIDLSRQAVADASGAGGGSIQLQGHTIRVREGSQVRTETLGAIAGRNLTINATELLEVDGAGPRRSLRSALSTETRGPGAAGDIFISTRRLRVLNGAIINAMATVSPRSLGSGGDLLINASESIEILGERAEREWESRVTTQARGTGPSGNIEVNTRRLTISGGGKISAGTLPRSFANSGNVTINASDFIHVSGTDEDGQQVSLIANLTAGAGAARNLVINTNRLIVEGGAVIAAGTISRSSDPNNLTIGNGGNLTITANASVEVFGDSKAGVEVPGEYSRSRISTRIEGEGSAGTLTITTRRLSIREGGEITAGTVPNSRGSSGSLTVNAQLVEVLGEIPVSPAGPLRSRLTTQTAGAGAAGPLRINTRTLRIRGGGQVTSDTVGAAQEGALVVNASQLVEVSGRSAVGDRRPSRLSNRTLGRSTAGNLTITTNQLLIQNGGVVSVSGESTGDAGNLTVRTNRLSILNGGTLGSNNSGSGSGGQINVRSRFVVVDGANSRISTENSSTGNAGSVNLVANQLDIRQGSISATTVSRRGGNITLRILGPLRVVNGSISASTETGIAGNVNLSATDGIQLQNGGRLVVEAGRGTAGSLTINTPQLVLRNRASVSVSTNQGRAGDLEVNARNLWIGNGSQIVGNTVSGRGGDINLQISDAITLQNNGTISASTQAGQGGNLTIRTTQLNVQNNSGIAASSDTGRAGQLEISAAETTLSNRGQLSVRATGDQGIAGDLIVRTGRFRAQGSSEATVSSPLGSAGDLQIFANSVRLNRSDLTAVAGVEGGNVQLLNLNLLLLRNSSLISAEALRNANGGNIAIGSDFIVAVPQENSDINANAFTGRGGNITINTDGLLGIASRSESTALSDITARSEFGLQGTISITQPDVQPTQGEAELPNTFAAPAIAQGCNATSAASSFVNTGRGGIPQNPTDSLTADAIWQDLEPLTPELRSRRNNAPSVQTTVSAESPQSVIEAQGWSRRSDGTVLLVAQATTATPHSGQSGDGTTCTVQRE